MWLDKVVKAIKERGGEEYTLTTSVSPTGIIHIGKLRDILLVFFVQQALIFEGKKAKTILYWDDYDVFHKGDGLIEQKGKPLILIRDENNNLLADTFKQRYYSELCNLGIFFDEIVSQAERYINREYDAFFEASYLRKKKIQKIQNSNYPVLYRAYCPSCHKLLENSFEYFRFYCSSCNEKFRFDNISEINYKLPFYIEWASRWAKDKSDFEPIGIDHFSPDGVFNKSKQISEEIFSYPVPVTQRYEFVGGSKGVKLSVSSKNGLSLTEFLKIFPREIIFWIFFKTDPKRYLILDINNDQYYLNCFVEYSQLLVNPTDRFKKFYEIIGELSTQDYTSLNYELLFQFVGFNYNGYLNIDRISQLPQFGSPRVIKYFNFWRSLNSKSIRLVSTAREELSNMELNILNKTLNFLLHNKEAEYEVYVKFCKSLKSEQKLLKKIIFGTYKIPQLSKFLYVYILNILEFYEVENES